ncbi:MAG: hypothetical protein DRQ46_07910, partial [Gammaproteobacteria bacterium]
MATDPTQFKVRFPEYADVDDSFIQIFLNDAALVMDEQVWGKYFDNGQAYLAAHYLAMANKGSAGGGAGVSGSVTGRTVDGVSVSYGSAQPVGGANSQTAGFYNTTQY